MSEREVDEALAAAGAVETLAREDLIKIIHAERERSRTLAATLRSMADKLAPAEPSAAGGSWAAPFAHIAEWLFASQDMAKLKVPWAREIGTAPRCPMPASTKPARPSCVTDEKLYALRSGFWEDGIDNDTVHMLCNEIDMLRTELKQAPADVRNRLAYLFEREAEMLERARLAEVAKCGASEESYHIARNQAHAVACVLRAMYDP